MAIFCAQSSYCVLPHLGCLPHTLSTSGFFSRFLRTVSFSELFCALARMVLLDDFLAQDVEGQVLGSVLDAGNPVWNCISNLASAGPNLFTLQMKKRGISERDWNVYIPARKLKVSACLPKCIKIQRQPCTFKLGVGCQWAAPKPVLRRAGQGW